MGNSLRIIFMGTPEIAVASLKALHLSEYTPVAVVTTPDKLAGRGLKLHESPVKQYAAANALTVLQPGDLKDRIFHEQLKSLSPDVIIVVAFRKLPAELLEIPAKGAFNLHASLLPQYRGAAPINWAIINGETETGVTTFLLDNRIDTGKILFREKVKISDTQTASQLHDVLMEVGARLVIKTIKAIELNEYQITDQDDLVKTFNLLRKAPKIKKEDCRICWNNKVIDIYNFIRGLCLHPGAFTELLSPTGDQYLIKILGSSFESSGNSLKTGQLETDGSSYLRVAATNGYLYFKRVQLAGKKVMNIDEFLRGFKISNAWRV
jgi:methionyl-tRNA formyltransferase